MVKCVRCGETFSADVATNAAYNYGGAHYMACPHCGKLYSFEKKIAVEPVERDVETDDWGNAVVKDENYNKD